jgi:hypothetical protein
MPYFGSNSNAEFQSGINHLANTHPMGFNENSITLDGGDPGLDADSDRWNSDVQQAATTPHSVLAPYAFSRNASANGSDGSNFVPGYGRTGTGNAESPQTFGSNMQLRMAGDSAAETD